MPFKIVQNDITKIEADIIVNSANPQPKYDRGTDLAIYKAAGENLLLEDRKRIGDIAVGEVAVTSAFSLKAKYILHTVGPMWHGGEKQEFAMLRMCYENALHKAVELNCESIAFPLLSTGVYKFPKDYALEIAISTISKFLLHHDMTVILVVFDPTSFQLSSRVFPNIDECLKPAGSLQDFTNNKEETFQEKLMQLIHSSDMDEVSIYKKANIDRKLFSKIRCKKDYKPSKKTAISLAIALELTVDQTRDLIGRAEIALSPCILFDRIIEYFIQHQIYDIYQIDLVLFQYNQATLSDI